MSVAIAGQPKGSGNSRKAHWPGGPHAMAVPNRLNETVPGTCA